MRRLLLVDDDELLREAYSALLSSQPYKFDTATNGLEALKLCQDKLYDLILLDLMMPVLDGVGFLKEFSKTNDLASTRVIVLSNLSHGTQLEEALRLGANQSFVKADLAPAELLSTIKHELSFLD